MLAPEATALAFHRACEKASVPYVIVGGLAVGAWGIPRATADVAAIAALDPSNLHVFAQALAGEGLLVDVRDLSDALSDRTHVTITDPRTNYHVDLKPALTKDESRQAEDAGVVRVSGGALRVASAEDTIAFKLLYSSPQDLQDARSIAIRQEGRLDLGRLRSLADRLGVGAALDVLLDEARAP